MSEAVSAALAGEYAVIYAYGRAGGRLTSNGDRALSWLAEHRTARDRLRQWLIDDGEQPPPPAPAYTTPGPVTTDRQARELLATVELRLIPLYTELIADQADLQSRRAWAIRQIRECALRAQVVGCPRPGFPMAFGADPAHLTPSHRRSLPLTERRLLSRLEVWGESFGVLACLALLAGCGGEDASPPEQNGESPPASSTPTAVAPVTQPTVVDTIADSLAAPWSVVPLAQDRALISERNSADILLLSDGRTTVAGQSAGGQGRRRGWSAGSGHAVTGRGQGLRLLHGHDRQPGGRHSTSTGRHSATNGSCSGASRRGPSTTEGASHSDRTVSSTWPRVRPGQPDLAQDRTSLAGKILRIKASGNPAPGNPDPASPVWSYGHRNVQGLAWDSAGRLWATEFGQQDVDELNLIEPGNNYGWPQCEGDCDIPGTTNPKATWSPTSTSSPSGLAIVDGSAWVAALRGETLYEVKLDGTRAEEPQAWFAGELGRLRDVVEAPDGTLWVLTNNTDGRGEPKTGDDLLLDVAIPG